MESANGTMMQTSATCSKQKEDDETSNNLRNEVLKVQGNELRKELALQYKRLNKDAIKLKLETLPKFVMGDYVFNLEFDIDESSIEKARKELRETPEIVEEALATIRKMIKEDPDLIIPDHDELFTRFMRPCKWYPKSAFHLMQRCFRFRANYPNIFKNLTPLELKNVFCADIITPLPERCKNGCRVVVIHGGYKWKPKENSLDDIFRAVMITLEAALFEPKTQVSH